MPTIGDMTSLLALLRSGPAPPAALLAALQVSPAKATVGKGAAFELDASTSGGEVDAAGITITIDHGGMGRSSLSGQVNGGGPLLTLRSSGGDIKVVTR